MQDIKELTIVLCRGRTLCVPFKQKFLFSKEGTASAGGDLRLHITKCYIMYNVAPLQVMDIFLGISAINVSLPAA